MMQDILVFLNRERDKNRVLNRRERARAKRGWMSETYGAQAQGATYPRHRILFNKPPPRGLMNSLLSSPLIFFIRRTGRKENQNRVRTPGQEKRMELEELELEPTPTSLRCAEIGRPGIASLPIPGAWADLAKGTPGN